MAASKIPSAKRFNLTHQNKATRDNTFFVADAAGATTGLSYWALSGAEKAWNSAEKANVVYNLDTRVAGHPADIRAILSDYRKFHPKDEADFAAGMTDDVIEEVISGKGGFTTFSAKNHGAAYTAELERVAAEKLADKEARADMAPSPFAMSTYANSISRGTFVAAAGAEAKARALPDKKKAAAGEKLTKEEEFVAALVAAGKAGKVVNVSEVDDEFKGRSTKAKHTQKVLYYLAGVPIESDDKAKYLMALRLWGKATGSSVAKYEEALGELKASVASVKKQVTAPKLPTSPKTSPSKTAAARRRIGKGSPSDQE